MTIDELIDNLTAARDACGGNTEVLMFATGELPINGYERVCNTGQIEVARDIDRTGCWYPAFENAEFIPETMRDAPARSVLALS